MVEALELQAMVQRLLATRDAEQEIDAYFQALQQKNEVEEVRMAGEVRAEKKKYHEVQPGFTWTKVVSGPRRHCTRVAAPLELRNQCEPLTSAEPAELVAPAYDNAWPPATTSKRWCRVMVVSNSFLRGTEEAICCPNPLACEVCCFSGAHV